MKKISFKALLGAALLITTFSTTANAIAPRPLTFYNWTSQEEGVPYVTVTISVNKQCSTDFGEIKPHDSKVVKTAELMDLCQENNVNCEAKVFDGPSCTGNQLASFTFDALNGVRIVTSEPNNYFLQLNYEDNSVTLRNSITNEKTARLS